MATHVVPGLTYEYIGTTLSGTSKTAVLTVGSGRAADCVWADVTSIVVVDSTGSVGTAAIVYVYDGSTERVLLPAGLGLPTAAENLEFEYAPLHLTTGGEIRVKGASGHHVHVSFVKGPARGSRAQGTS